jgi:hypothetical protein
VCKNHYIIRDAVSQGMPRLVIVRWLVQIESETGLNRGHNLTWPKAVRGPLGASVNRRSQERNREGRSQPSLNYVNNSGLWDLTPQPKGLPGGQRTRPVPLSAHSQDHGRRVAHQQAESHRCEPDSSTPKTLGVIVLACRSRPIIPI